MSPADAPPKPPRRATAESMASKQREISVSEFFTKNRHLLGFDNPAKALLTTVKEAVDNSLDACEEAGILPTLLVEIIEISRKPLPRRGRGQRPRHRQGANPEDLRQAPLRVEVSPLEAVPRAAGHRHQRRRALRHADHRQADRDSLQDRQGAPALERSSFASTPSENQPDVFNAKTRSSGTKTTAPASSSSWSAPTAGAAPASTRTSSRRWSPTRTSSSPTARPRAELHDLPARVERAAARGAGDQAAPARRRARDAAQDAAGRRRR